MPLLFALGKHASLCAIDKGFAEGERLMAFLDDVHISTKSLGFRWRASQILRRVGTDCPGIWGAPEQGIRVLGTPLGHADHMETQLRERLDDHQLLLNRIPEVPRSPVSVGLSLLHCASARANWILAGGQARVGPRAR